MRSCIHRRLAPSLGLLAIVSLAAPEARGAWSHADDRILAGHPFLPSALIGQPFNTRHYTMAMSVGYARFNFADVPGIVDLGFPYDQTRRFSEASLSLTTIVQQPLLDWMALRVALQGGLTVGADQYSAVLFGGDGGYMAAGGVLFNPLHIDRFSLSIAFDAMGGENYLVTPYPFYTRIADAVNADQVPELNTSNLFGYRRGFSLAPSLTFAVGLFEAMGVYGELAYDYTESRPRGAPDEFDHTLEIGGGLSINVDPYGVPIGLNLAYQRQEPVGKNRADPLNLFEIGLFYAHGKHFVFGLGAAGSYGKLRNGAKYSVWAGQLAMTYYE